LADTVGFLDGDVGLHGLANYVSKYESIVPGALNFNQAGQDSNPMWRWTLQLNYRNGPWHFFVQGRYTGSGYFDKSTAATDLPQFKIGGQIPIDTTLSYDIPTSGGTTQVFLNATDLFNDQPPPFTNALGSNNYDFVGRYVRTGIKLTF